MSKIVRPESPDAAKPWTAPKVSGRKAGGGSLITAGELEDIQTQVYREAHEAGYRDGLASAEQKLGELAAQLQEILQALARPLAELDEEVEQELVELALALSRQIVRRELKTSPDRIIGIVREALSVLPVGSRDIKVALHPEDARLVESLLATGGGDAAWEIVEDPVLSRGGCVVSTSHSRIDAQLDKRLGAIVSAVLGGERAGEKTSNEETDD